jgi:hypothetical protein
VTFDGWTSDKSQLRLIALTGHYLTQEWILKEILLQVFEIPDAHTGEAMGAYIKVLTPS